MVRCFYKRIKIYVKVPFIFSKYLYCKLCTLNKIIDLQNEIEISWKSLM